MTTSARVTSLIALALIALLAVVPARAQAAFTLGLSEQKLGMWQDARFSKLEVRHVRLIVAYDLVLKGDFSRYDAWMAAADARGMDVLVAFNHATDSNTRLPSVTEYRRAVRNLRARYPRIKAMSAWNEANHSTQPTHRNPRRAAAYYNALRQECRGCRIVAADVLDQKGMEGWLSTFKRHARAPRLWGLHNYGDANHFKPLARTGTAKLLRLVEGEVWLTEAGGIVRFGSYYRGGRAGEARAARATRQTFALARMSPRIKRVYLYHWDAEQRFITWDSGLVDATGRARPALEVVRSELNRQRRAQGRRPIGRLPVTRPRLLPLLP